jgi:hypothetical protein
VLVDLFDHRHFNPRAKRKTAGNTHKNIFLGFFSEMMTEIDVSISLRMKSRQIFMTEGMKNKNA